MTSVNYFTKNVIPEEWVGEIELSTIKGRVDWRRTLNRVPCGDGLIDIGFHFNGASVGALRFAFPKWKHPIATCRHDHRCNIAHTQKMMAKLFKYFSKEAKAYRKEYRRLRKFADKEFKKDVDKTGNKYEKYAGYAAVRVGAFF